MEQPPALGQAPALEPKSIKVFGVLHLVLGGFGVIGIIYSLAQFIFRDFFIKMSAGGEDEMLAFQTELHARLLVPTLIAFVFSLAITFFMIRAGLKLVKGKKDAVKASNLYSIVSIAGKVVALILALVFTIPAINELIGQMMTTSAGEAAAMPAMQQTISMMKTMMSVSGILSPILMSLYPVLAMIILKRKVVTDFLAQHGK